MEAWQPDAETLRKLTAISQGQDPNAPPPVPDAMLTPGGVTPGPAVGPAVPPTMAPGQPFTDAEGNVVTPTMAAPPPTPAPNTGGASGTWEPNPEVIPVSANPGDWVGATPPQAQPAAATGVPFPAAAPATGPGLPTPPTPNNLGTAYDAKSAAIGQQSQADAQQAEEVRQATHAQMASLEGQDAAIREQQQIHQQRMDAAQKQYTDANSALQSFKFQDPWKSRSWGDKIMGAVAVALGALGSGMTHGPNYALQIINQKIDQEVQQQQRQYDALKDTAAGKLTAFNMLRQKGLDDQQAQQVLRANLLDRFKTRLDEIAANHKGTQIAANAASLQADLEAQRQTAQNAATQQGYDNQVKREQLALASREVGAKEAVAGADWLKALNQGQQQRFQNLPKERQVIVESLGKSIGNKMTVRTTLDETVRTMTDAMAKGNRDEAIVMGQQILKVLNSQEGQDAVGTQEAQRLASQLEYHIWPNLTQPGAVFGRDVKGFMNTLRLTSQRLGREVDQNQRLIDLAYVGRNLSGQVASFQPAK